MFQEYIHAKSLALFTGSPVLMGFINQLKSISASEEIFRFIKRLIKQSFRVDTFQMENNIQICITRRDYFYEVSLHLQKLFSNLN